jgi:predicted AlkP superfamily pyrophosphatase or phosphodiesterase
MNRLFLVLLAALALLTACKHTAEPRPIADHVILIGSDAFSSAVIRANPGAFPNLERLIGEGSHTLEHRTVLPSSSAVNWASMLMGAGPELHGYTTWGSAKPDLPSRVLTENELFPCIMYLLRAKYPHAELGAGYTWPTIGRLYDQKAANFNFANPGADENVLCEAICEYIEQTKPMFTFVAFDEPDVTGHTHGWESEEYLEQCKAIDSYVGRILAAAERSMAGDHIVIFTSDHGGRDTGHGGKSMAEMQVPLILWGKGIRNGHTIEESTMMFDTAATLAHIFRLEKPQVWIGRPVMSAFE